MGLFAKVFGDAVSRLRKKVEALTPAGVEVLVAKKDQAALSILLGKLASKRSDDEWLPVITRAIAEVASATDDGPMLTNLLTYGPGAPEPWPPELGEFKSELVNNEVLCAIAEVLARMGERGAVPAIRDLAKRVNQEDTDRPPRVLAALHRLGDTDAADELALRVRGPYSGTWLWKLAEIGDRRAVRHLVDGLKKDLLGSYPGSSAFEAVRYLGMCAGPEDLTVLEGLHSAVAERRADRSWIDLAAALEAACHKVGGVQYQDATARKAQAQAARVAALEAELATIAAVANAGTPSSSAAQTALGSLTALVDLAEREQKVSLLQDALPYLEKLIEILGNAGDPSSAEPVARVLDAELSRPTDFEPGSDHSALAAARALGKIRHELSVAALVRSLSGSCHGFRTEVRTAAAKSLEQLGDRRAIGPMLHAAGDSELELRNGFEVREAIVASLEALVTAEDLPTVQESLRSDNYRECAVAAQIMRRFNRHAAADALSRSFGRAPDDQARRTIILAIETVGGAEAATALTAIVPTTSGQIRELAQGALKQCGA